jgi:hypothetical protein
MEWSYAPRLDIRLYIPTLLPDPLARNAITFQLSRLYQTELKETTEVVGLVKAVSCY